MTEPTDRPTHRPLIADRPWLVAGLRELANFLEANPDTVPVDSARVVYFPSGQLSKAEAVAEVDAIAASLGVESGQQNSRSPHHVATRMFGPVSYEAGECDVYDLPKDAEDES